MPATYEIGCQVVQLQRAVGGAGNGVTCQRLLDAAVGSQHTQTALRGSFITPALCGGGGRGRGLGRESRESTVQWTPFKFGVKTVPSSGCLSPACGLCSSLSFGIASIYSYKFYVT